LGGIKQKTVLLFPYSNVGKYSIAVGKYSTADHMHQQFEILIDAICLFYHQTCTIPDTHQLFGG